MLFIIEIIFTIILLILGWMAALLTIPLVIASGGLIFMLIVSIFFILVMSAITLFFIGCLIWIIINGGY